MTAFAGSPTSDGRIVQDVLAGVAEGLGTLREFLEIDDATWSPVTDARAKLDPRQLPILDAPQETSVPVTVTVRSGRLPRRPTDDGARPVAAQPCVACALDASREANLP